MLVFTDFLFSALNGQCGDQAGKFVCVLGKAPKMGCFQLWVVRRWQVQVCLLPKEKFKYMTDFSNF